MSFNSSKQSDRRKTVSLSIKKKLDILKKLDAGSKVWNICNEYGIGRSTVYDIKQQKKKILKFSEQEIMLSKRKQMRPSRNVSHDQVMLDWVRESYNKGELLTGPILMAQAKIFHDVMGIEDDCVYSIKWLNGFKKRFGIRLRMFEVEGLENSSQEDETQAQTEDSDLSPKYTSKKREQPKRSARSTKSAIYTFNSSDEDTSDSQEPASSTSKLKSEGTTENEIGSFSADATISDSPIVIKQEMIEIEDPSHQSSASCSRDSFSQVQGSERLSLTVSSADSNSWFQNLKSFQKGVKRPRRNTPVACSSKDDPPENSEVSDISRAQDSFDAFGVFVASKLRKLDWKSCAYVQKAFTDVLFEAELGLFLTPEEKTSFEKKSDSLVVGLQEAVADISTAELSSHAESAESISSSEKTSSS